MFKYHPNDSGLRENAEGLCAKGVSRRVVVVPADDNPLYEQVIYVVKDEAASHGVSAQEVLREANRCLLPSQEEIIFGEPMPEPDAQEEPDRLSRLLFTLSGIALALSSGLLIYWFFAA